MKLSQGGTQITVNITLKWVLCPCMESLYRMPLVHNEFAALIIEKISGDTFQDTTTFTFSQDVELRCIASI